MAHKNATVTLERRGKSHAATTSFGEAVRISFASIVFAMTAQMLLGLFGLVVLIALRRGDLHNGDLWRVLLISCVPYAVLGLQTTWNAVQGVGGVFAKHYPPPTEQAIKEDLRLIPVYRQHVPTFAGVDVEDLRFFIRRICVTRDWTQRRWRGKRMPSGAVCDNDYHRMMIAVLKDAGFLIGHKPRSRGQLLCYHAEQILAHLGINEPARSQESDSPGDRQYYPA